MSVDVFAAPRRSRRRGDLPCRESAEPTPWAVTIRVAGQTFTSDCRDQDDAVATAQRIAAEFEQHYRRIA